MALYSSLLHQWSLEVISTCNFNVIIFSAAAIIIFSFVRRRINEDHINLPPSPPKLPIIGNLHQIGKLLHRSLHTLSTKYGPLMTLHLGSSPFLIVSSAEIVEEIVKQQDVIFSGRVSKQSIERLMANDIAFSQYNNYLRFVKKISVVQLLSSMKVQAFHFVREEETGRAREKIKLACQEKAVVDLSEIFITINSHIIARSTFGRVLNYSCESAAKLVKKAIHLGVGIWVGDLFPYLGWIDFVMGNTKRLNSICQELHNFLDRVIEDHQALKHESHEEKDFLDILLDVQQDATADIRITNENIKAILLDMFLAGTETSGSVLEWAMAELVMNPSIMKKTQGEVRRVVGPKSEIDENDVNEMKYLKLVIKETMRLHPPILVPRVTSESTVLRGYNIPANIQVLINVWAIQRDPKLWESPEEFRPERFADHVNVDFKGNQSHYFPFGMGRRICPGATHANVVMEYVLANFLYWFDWKLPPCSSLQDFEMNDSYETVIHKRKPLLLVPVQAY